MVSLQHPTLLVAGLVALCAGSVYLVVAQTFKTRARSISSGDAPALGFFALWWAALGLNILIAAGFYLAASIGLTDFALQYAYAHLQRFLLAASLFGLLYYLVYLVTGRGRLRTILAFYCLFLVLTLYSLQLSQPQGLYIGQWRTDLQYTQPVNRPIQLVSFAALVLPPVVASLAYFRIYFQLEPKRDRSQRYRILLVSWSIILWWVMAAVAGQREAYGQEWFQLVNRFTGLAAALAILVAYVPPAPIRRWLLRHAEPDTAPTLRVASP